MHSRLSFWNNFSPSKSTAVVNSCSEDLLVVHALSSCCLPPPKMVTGLPGAERAARKKRSMTQRFSITATDGDGSPGLCQEPLVVSKAVTKSFRERWFYKLGKISLRQGFSTLTLLMFYILNQIILCCGGFSYIS